MRFFRWFCDPDYLEDIEGDLLERFEKRTEQNKRASWLLTLDVLRLFRPGIIKNFEGTQKLNYYGMFKHNLKFGWRNLMKQKGFFAINVFGLAIGISTCLMISLFIIDELNYDKFNENADRIARVVLKGEVQGEAINEAIAPAGVVPAFQEEFPEVQIGTRLKATEIPLVYNGKENFRESRFAYVDPNFFSVFTAQFLKGDPRTALDQPNTILITESEAAKYFGSKDPLGKTLEFKDWGKKFKITGVIADIPANSHFHFDLFGSMKSYDEASKSDWLKSDFHSYILLRDNAELETVQTKIPATLAKYMGPQLQDAFGISMEQFEESGNKIGLFLQPLLSIHLFSDFSSQSELQPGGNIDTLYIFGIIAVFALLISCVNFINLSTAAASRRMKEVGVKKVLGSGRRLLVTQFLTESFLTTVMAMLVSALIIGLSLRFFNEISGKSFLFRDFLKPNTILLYYGLFGLSISLLAGLYPAFVLSSSKPLWALAQKTQSGGNAYLRSSLVVFQFAVSTILVIGTIIVQQQMDFINEKEVGYDKEGLIVIHDTEALGQANQLIFKDKLLGNSLVENVSISNHLPAGPTNTSMDNVFLNEGSKDFRRSPVYNVDDSYIPTMGIEILAGRNFSKDFGSESNLVIINETFASTFGLGENPVGKTIETTLDQQGERKRSTVIGLVKDFHFQSLHRKIEPLMFRKRASSGVIVRAGMSNIPQILIQMEDLWKEFNADEPFNYALLDDLYKQTYVSEQNVGSLFKTFAALTIFVATLGLFGLVTFSIARRTKEIGIRKVLGSSISSIISLISWDFLKLIGIALIVAIPIGYFSMLTWLEDFAYRISISWWVFAAAGAITLLISWITVASKAWIAAIVNPIEVLKDE